MKPYLFLHIPKTGGTSIAKVLPHGRTTDKLLQHRLDELAPVGYTATGGRTATLVNKKGVPVAYPAKPHHYTLEQYEELDITKLKDFDKLYKFAFVRNPWDRVVSMYTHLLRSSHQKSTPSADFDPLRHKFLHFVREMNSIIAGERYYHCGSGHYTPQTKYTHDSEGNQIVDFIGRYETMSEDLGKLNEICAWGLSEIEIPYLNKTVKEHPDYRSYYCDGNGLAKALVAEIFATEIELYGYEF